MDMPITPDETLTILGRPITAEELAKARQGRATASPSNAGFYDWENLRPDEQQAEVLDAASWLRALAGLLDQVSPAALELPPRAAAPPGFQPRSSIRSLWLHTVEFDAHRCLAGAVVVTRMRHLNEVAELIEVPAGMQRVGLILHHTEDEVWLRLDRVQVMALRRKLGEMNERTSPFGDQAYDAYSALVEIDNIIDHEED